MLHVMIGGVADYGHIADPELWRRYVGLLLDGLRAQPGAATALTHPPLSERELDRVMSTWRCH